MAIPIQQYTYAQPGIEDALTGILVTEGAKKYIDFINDAGVECAVTIENEDTNLTKLCIEFFDSFNNAMAELFEEYPQISNLVASS